MLGAMVQVYNKPGSYIQTVQIHQYEHTGIAILSHLKHFKRVLRYNGFKQQFIKHNFFR